MASTSRMRPSPLPCCLPSTARWLRKSLDHVRARCPRGSIGRHVGHANGMGIDGVEAQAGPRFATTKAEASIPIILLPPQCWPSPRAWCADPSEPSGARRSLRSPHGAWSRPEKWPTKNQSHHCAGDGRAWSPPDRGCRANESLNKAIGSGQGLRTHRTREPIVLANAADIAFISIKIHLAFPSSCPWPSLSPAPLSP